MTWTSCFRNEAEKKCQHHGNLRGFAVWGWGQNTPRDLGMGMVVKAGPVKYSWPGLSQALQQLNHAQIHSIPRAMIRGG